MFLAELKKIGLTSGEAAIYNFLIRNGDASASQIAKLTGLGRTNVYEYAESLEKLHLVNEYEKSNKIFFHAESPKELRPLLQSKIQQLHDVETSFNNILPEIEAEYLKNSGMPVIKHFFGDLGRAECLEIIYTHGSNREVYILLKDLDTYDHPEPKYKSIIQKRGLKVFLIGNKGESLVDLQKRDKLENRETRLVNSLLSSDIVLVEDKIFFGNFNKKTFSVSMLQSFALSSFIQAQISGLK